MNRPVDRNSESTKTARREYVSLYLANAFNSCTVFVDEAGCNLWTHRTRGRSKIGLPAVRIVGGQRGRNISIILATSSHFGLVHSSLHFGGTTIVIMEKFIEELNTKLINLRNVHIIMENASCHNVI